MDLEHFSLRWNNFHSNLSAGFQALLQEEDLVDVTLAAGGEFVQAHKIVLSVCSPYFKQLFKINPCKHPIVILKDVCHKDLVDILQFMYRGEVNVRQEDLATFLKTAELLQVKGLTGQDSPSSTNQPQETTQPSERTERLERLERMTSNPQQPRIRNRRRAEKIHTQPQPSPSMPPFKRVRTEPPLSSSPVLLNDDSSMSGVEFVDMPVPKQEPVDFDISAEPQSAAEESRVSDSLEQLLAGESSHSMHGLSSDQTGSGPQQLTAIMDTKMGLGLPPEQGTGEPIAGASGGSADTSTPQDGEQGGLCFVRSKKGNLQLVHDGYIYNLYRQNTQHKIHWRCTRYRNGQCRGLCKTVHNVMLETMNDHNHERQYDKIYEKQALAQSSSQFLSTLALVNL